MADPTLPNRVAEAMWNVYVASPIATEAAKGRRNMGTVDGTRRDLRSQCGAHHSRCRAGGGGGGDRCCSGGCKWPVIHPRRPPGRSTGRQKKRCGRLYGGALALPDVAAWVPGRDGPL